MQRQRILRFVVSLSFLGFGVMGCNSQRDFEPEVEETAFNIQLQEQGRSLSQGTHPLT